MAGTDLFALARDVDTDRCRLRGRFVLRSGQITGEYFDKDLFESDPALLPGVAERMVGLIPAGPDLLGGLELGGVPLATMLSRMTALRTLFISKAAKMRGVQVDKDVVAVGGQAEISGRHPGHGFVGSLGQADLDPAGVLGDDRQ